MEYVLVHKNNVEFGPVGWNTRIFNTVLNDDLGINYTVTIAQQSDAPIIIDADTKIMPSRYVYPATGGGITQSLAGPTWDFSGTEAIGTYVYQDKDISMLKLELKAEVAAERWQKQIAGTTAEINSTEVRVGTTKEDKDILVAAMADGLSSRNWKFGNVWLVVDNAGLQTAVDAIAQHVQAQFDWEAQKSSDIDACTTLAALAEFHAAYIESLTPVQPQPEQE